MLKDWLIPLAVGFGTGILSAWGVGGGTLLLLLMTLFLDVDQVAAQGINLLYFLPTAAVGLIFHAKNGLLDKTLLKNAAPFGTVFAAIGAWVSTTVDVALLRKPFGIYLLLAAAVTLFGAKKVKNER